MLRSIHVLGACLLLTACAQTSQAPTMVTAPSASATATAAAITTAGAVTVTATAGATPSPGGPAEAPASYRACRADADCTAVARAGCCKHGWKEAVNASKADAYAQAFACTTTPRPICPMFMVRDARVAKCDQSEHLCEMVQP